MASHGSSMVILWYSPWKSLDLFLEPSMLSVARATPCNIHHWVAQSYYPNASGVRRIRNKAYAMCCHLEWRKDLLLCGRKTHQSYAYGWWKCQFQELDDRKYIESKTRLMSNVSRTSSRTLAHNWEGKRKDNRKRDPWWGEPCNNPSKSASQTSNNSRISLWSFGNWHCSRNGLKAVWAWV